MDSSNADSSIVNNGSLPTASIDDNLDQTSAADSDPGRWGDLFEEEDESSRGNENDNIIVAEKRPLTFTFGRRSFTLADDGETIATKIWTSGLVVGDLLHAGSCLDVEKKGSNTSLLPDTRTDSSLLALSGRRRLDVAGLDVLEIGCGCSLAGLIAALHGCESLTLADCDDRALMSLFALYQPEQPGYRQWWQEGKHDARKINSRNSSKESIDSAAVVCGDLHFHHHLWEEDLREVETLEKVNSNVAGAGAEIDEDVNDDRQLLPLPHWSDAYRCPEHAGCQVLDVSQTFDVIIASDCLYFLSQELPLVAVLKLRLRKCPTSFALIVTQTRSGGAKSQAQEIRIRESLQQAGLDVESFQHEHANMEQIYSRHLSFGGPVPSASTAATDAASTSSPTLNVTSASLEGVKHVMVARWKSQLAGSD